ncbi:MAG TPA: signal peptide peptidase SppA [Terriglobales bacterium]|nr:signal peptide peptidase SppA [Terriglobales bacterium]
MSRFNRFLAWLGGLTLLSIVLMVIVVVAVSYGKKRIPAKTVLELNLERETIEDIPDDAVAKAMLRDRLVVRDVVDALDRAADDKRVVGLVARIGAARMGTATTQEIRDAVLRFRAKKKFAVAFAETFGEFGPGGNSYYLATAFDEIWLQPSGDIGLTGAIAESPFLRGTLEKLGMRFRGDHRYEYKNALNLFTETKYTPAHREATAAVVNSLFGQHVRGIAEARKISAEEVRTLIDRGPFLGSEGVDAKLVDGVAYRDEVYDKVKKRAGDGAELLYSEKYLERAERPHTKGKSVALIFGVGSVQRGKSGFNGLQGDVHMGSDTVTAAFRAAIEDKDVKAIVFRIDSPGGSYVASDAIWREVVRARKAGKPVVATMSDVAGSGGYFVAMAADKIVAQPGTITASIGVLGGKFLTSGFWNKVGLSWDEVHTSANATMWTGTHDYTASEWQRFQAWLDRVYVDFTSKVADGRKLPKERVLQVAKGRIWSGEDAKNLGLVDELGGYATALSLAKKAATIPETEDVNIVVFPKRKKLIEVLLSEGAESSEGEAVEAAIVRTVKAIQPLARRLRLLSPAEQQDVLRMPEVEMSR